LAGLAARRQTLGFAVPESCCGKHRIFAAAADFDSGSAALQPDVFERFNDVERCGKTLDGLPTMFDPRFVDVPEVL
jgi:hypothetical protein